MIADPQPGHDHIRRVVREIGLTAGNDFEAVLDCGHHHYFDTASWGDTKAGPVLYPEEWLCFRCEDQCPECKIVR